MNISFCPVRQKLTFNLFIFQPQQSDLKLESKNESWTNTHSSEASTTDKIISDDETLKKKASPTKKVKKKSKVKKTKTVVKIQKILKVKNKEKKLNLNKDELAKYSDENLREVALKMKNGCDCPENCFKSELFLIAIFAFVVLTKKYMNMYDF
jgi:hypothetical protein